MKNPPESWAREIKAERNKVAGNLDELRETLHNYFNQDFSRKILTVAGELLTNALEHGCVLLDRNQKEELLERDELDLFLNEWEKLDRNLNIVIIIEFSTKEVSISVSDPGPGINFPMVDLHEKKSIGGRGLELVQKLSADLYWTQSPSSVTAILRTQ